MSGEGRTRAALTAAGKVLIEQPDGSFRRAKGSTDWRRVNALTNAAIERAAQSDPDAPLLDEHFWATTRVVVPPRIPKRHQGMRLDQDVIDWFKAQGPGWQTRMNAVLRSYVEAHKKAPPQPPRRRSGAGRG
jgi:uncharacterized protein (DUF4415 family)